MLLFEGNRVMLFRTALALMDLYGIEINKVFPSGFFSLFSSNTRGIKQANQAQ